MASPILFTGSIMKKTVLLLAHLMRVLSIIALWISAVCLVAMTLVIFWQVYGRYVLNQSPSWSEATALLLMGWFVLLGAGVGIRRDDHLGFNLLLHVLPQRRRQILQGINFVLIAGFGTMMTNYGLQLARGTWGSRIPGLPLPQGFQYLPLVVGGALITLFALEKLLEQIAWFGEKNPNDEKDQKLGTPEGQLE